MFSFLKDNWVNEYTNEEEKYLEYYPQLLSLKQDENILERSEKILEEKEDENQKIQRIKELEEQNLKFLSQITNLQSILCIKSNLYLEYKEKYEVIL